VIGNPVRRAAVKRSVRIQLMLMAAIVAVIPLAASPADDTAIVSRVDALLARTVRSDGPGAVVLVARGDDVIVRRARGRAQIELGVPLSADHVFRIASVTKMFTAASILKLAEAGKLSLDDTLATHLPGMTEAGRVTIRQLLTHSAGIPEGPRKGTDRAARLAEIGARPLAFEPGTKWSYSNSGYILLGAVIEKVTGQAWDRTLQQQFFDPLQLTRTRYGDNAALIDGRAAGYTTEGREVRNVVPIDSAIPDAAGALISTADDLLRWMRALTTGRAIDRASFARMIAPSDVPPAGSTRDRYGLGVYVWQVRGQLLIGHTGQIPGFASVVAYLPAQDVTIVALGNDDNFDARQMGRRLAAIAIGDPYPDVTPVAATAETMQALTGAYRIDDTTVRTLSVENGRLYAQRGSGNRLPLQITAEGRLHFDPDALSYFVPVRDAAGAVVRLDYFPDGEPPAQPLPRVVPAASQSR
jgi:CubicO group peptidase (beta-lactamase class C family)